MARAKENLSTLKEKAAEMAAKQKEIVAKIKELENARALEIGRFVVDIEKRGWADFDAESFKTAITALA